MLSKPMIRKKHMESVCETSRAICRGDAFRGCRVAEGGGRAFLPEDQGAVCLGAISEEELLFRTQDGRCYFSIRDGWGEEDGILYGLKAGFSLDFGHPMSEEELLSEGEVLLGRAPRSWSEAMAYRVKKEMLLRITAVIQRSN